MAQMKFNADTYLEAIEAPTITINGVEYTAKHLSFNDALKFQGRFEDSMTTENIPKFVTELCDAVGLPADKILELPPIVFQKVLSDFLAPLVTGQVTE